MVTGSGGTDALPLGLLFIHASVTSSSLKLMSLSSISPAMLCSGVQVSTEGGTGALNRCRFFIIMIIRCS